MDSKGTGLTLSIGVVAAFIGYILWQLSIGFNTKVDDIATILTNSAASAGLMESIRIVLIGGGGASGEYSNCHGGAGGGATAVFDAVKSDTWTGISRNGASL